MAQFLKIYGLERSGTNYLCWVLRRAFIDVDVLVNDTGWKHGDIPAFPDWTGLDWSDPAWPQDLKHQHARMRLRRLGPKLDVLRSAVAAGELLTCAIVKDPYAWVGSYSKYRDVPCSPVDVDMITRWNGVNALYLHHASREPHRMAVIRYEDLVVRPGGTVDQLAARFGLRRNSRSRFAQRLAMTMWDRPGASVFDLSRYTDKKYLLDYSFDDRRRFLDHLNTDLMSSLGYALHIG